MLRWLAYTRNKVIHSSLQLNFSDSYMVARQRRSRRNSRSFPVISPISGLTCVHVYIHTYTYTLARFRIRVRTCVHPDETCQGLSSARRTFLRLETSYCEKFTGGIKYQSALIELSGLNASYLFRIEAKYCGSFYLQSQFRLTLFFFSSHVLEGNAAGI